MIEGASRRPIRSVRFETAEKENAWLTNPHPGADMMLDVEISGQADHRGAGTRPPRVDDEDLILPQHRVVDISLPQVDEALVRNRAYELYEERGAQDGSALDDWLQAEAEICERTRSSARAAD